MGKALEKLKKKIYAYEVITMVEYLIMVIILMTQEIFLGNIEDYL